MHKLLEYPFFSRSSYEVDDAVIAALQAEVLWLCRSGELDQLYRAYPCFMSRTQALQSLIKHDRLDSLARKFQGRSVHIVAACH